MSEDWKNKYRLNPEQTKACKAVARAIERGKCLGLRFYGMSDSLVAYQDAAFIDGVVQEKHLAPDWSLGVVPYEPVCNIADSGADDPWMFKPKPPQL